VKVLVAEDDPLVRRAVRTLLTKWGYDVVTVRDGNEAWQVLQKDDAPELALLDWMMPEVDGIDVCRKVRQMPDHKPVYIILLTARGRKDDITDGFKAGADDYVIKPFEQEELRARVHAGARIVRLQSNLAHRLRELEDALSRVKQLHGLLPVCCYCKKVRDDQNYWHQVERYIAEHSEVEVSQSICPECHERFVKPQLEKMNWPRGGAPGRVRPPVHRPPVQGSPEPSSPGGSYWA